MSAGGCGNHNRDAGCRPPPHIGGTAARADGECASGSRRTAMSRHDGSRRIEAAEGGRRSQRAPAETTGLVKPAFTSSDDDLVACLQAEGGGRSGRQLDHALSAPHEPHHTPPRMQVRVDLLHAFLAVEEYRIDRKPHEDHGDAAPLASIDPYPTSCFQLRPEHEADGSAENGAGNHEIFGQYAAGAFMDRSRTRHLNGVA